MFDCCKHLVNGCGVLLRYDGIEKILVWYGHQNGHGSVWMQRREYNILSQERILYIWRYIVLPTHDEFYVFPQHFVTEVLVTLILLRVEQPMSHSRVNREEEKKQNNDMIMRKFFLIQQTLQAVQALDCVCVLHIVLFDVVNHFFDQQRCKFTMSCKHNVE